MKDDYLTDEEYRRDFHLTPEEGRTLWRGVFGRVGYVLGPDGENGSGVFVKTRTGRRVLLTCAHVVQPVINKGGVWIGGYNYDATVPGSMRSRRVAVCKPAHEFFLSTTCDVALAYAPDDLLIREFLEPAAWDPRATVDPSSLSLVIAAGQPADPNWKTKPRVEEKIIDEMKTLLMWTTSTMIVPDAGLIELLALRTAGVMPASYEGMSGGPLFSTRGQLLGILTEESEPDHPGRIYAIERSQWLDIY